MERYRHVIPYPIRRRQLAARSYHYPYKLAAGRYLGYLKPLGYAPRWVAVGCTLEGKYVRGIVGKTDDQVSADNKSILTFARARRAACRWFDHTERRALLIEAYPIQHKGQLCICPIGEAYTVGHALRDYFAWKRATGSSNASIQPSVATANAYIVPLLAHVPAAGMKPRDFRNVLTTVAAVPKTLIGVCEADKNDFESLDFETQQTRKKRANSVYAILRSALRRAWQQGQIEDDRPWRQVKPFLTNPPEPPFIPTPEQIGGLLRASEPDFRNLIQACYLTGCTLREVLQLQADWISLSDGILSVPKGGGGRSRNLPLSQQTLGFFRAVLSQADPSLPLFLRCSGGEFTESGARNRLVIVRDRANLPKGFTFRSLRDAHAVALLSAGLSVTYVARQIGLSNGTVLDRYGHCVDDFIDRDLSAHFPFGFEKGAPGLAP